MKSIFAIAVVPYCRPGPKMASPLGWFAAAAPSRVEKLNPKRLSTQTVMTAVPTSSSPALMICTQVVPRIPPTST